MHPRYQTPRFHPTTTLATTTFSEATTVFRRLFSATTTFLARHSLPHPSLPVPAQPLPSIGLTPREGLAGQGARPLDPANLWAFPLAAERPSPVGKRGRNFPTGRSILRSQPGPRAPSHGGRSPVPHGPLPRPFGAVKAPRSVTCAPTARLRRAVRKCRAGPKRGTLRALTGPGWLLLCPLRPVGKRGFGKGRD